MTSQASPLDTVLARFVLSHLPEPALVLDREGTIVETNRAMAELEDRELSALLQAPSASPVMAGFLAELRANGRAIRELPWPSPSASKALPTQAPAEPARRTRLVGVSIDEHAVLTVVRAPQATLLEEELGQCRRVQMLGLMTARIVHDLNNLLTPILIFSRELADLGTLQGEPRALVRDLEAAAERAAALIKDILDFARPRAAEAECVSLNSVILALRPMLNLALRKNVSLRISLDERPTHVRVDRSRLEQTLLNLVNNAVSAMPHGGEISVLTANVVAREHGEHSEPKEYVVLVLNDTGIGMTDEVRSRAFDDFFTTHSAGGGTGLGLSSVRQFVRDSGGLIHVESEVGRGTSVIIHLPRVGRAGGAGKGGVN